jgi:23S rRNA (uracil747-C5)-methyltransferase
VQCDYFDSGTCRSCTLLDQPYPDQVAAKQLRARAVITADSWDPPLTSAEQGFRTKAKLVVGGTVEAPTLGILGADLRRCPLHAPALVSAAEQIAEFITLARLTPYDVPSRRGELKYVILTEGDGLMVRFVLRSTESLARIRKHLPHLDATVVSVNLQPEHKAIVEGVQEIVLRGTTLPMTVGDVVLHLTPRAFSQTNTAVAGGLYRTAREWLDGLDVQQVWDLYCGVGGFALHLGAEVVGVETSVAAVDAARRSAAELDRTATFVVDDAAAFVRSTESRPDLVVVNPPRRGVGDLASWLEESGPRWVLYSSCYLPTLATDLAVMSSYRASRARVVDMFPQTEHTELLVLLERQPLRAARTTP